MDGPPPLARFSLYFLKLGALGFGGPIALAGAMQRDLVEERGWISREDYVEGLALAQLAPGPLAAQLAIYLGYVRGGVLGATLVGLAFILPSFLMVLVISALYVKWGGLRPMQALFYGIGAAVVGIIARSAAKLTRTTLKNDTLAWLLFGATAVITAATGRELISVVLLSGVVALFVKAPPRLSRDGPGAGAAALLPPILVTGLHGAADGDTLLRLLLYFAKAGAFVFGSGLAIVPFLYGGVVGEHHWLTEKQFLDAVAVAMITPGPVVITVAFIGYLVAGPLGATASALGVFLPVWLFVVIPAPYFRKFAAKARLHAFVLGVTASATGAIAGAAVVIARGAVRDLPT
ncbi:MAG: chromate efflux transporter, partial [Thermoanaerobaculia bacterium]|nr:chromate efflux transporter [Thermoanaerobaculia bacterium]